MFIYFQLLLSVYGKNQEVDNNDEDNDNMDWRDDNNLKKEIIDLKMFLLDAGKIYNQNLNNEL